MSLILDLARMPRSAKKPAKEKKKTCIPGDRLFNISDGYRSGFGTYEERGSIIASLCGYVCVRETASGGVGFVLFRIDFLISDFSGRKRE